MARPIRLDYPDSSYHVLCRGNDRRDIFLDKKDYLKFLDILTNMVEWFKVDAYAYMLMKKNHHHLLIRTMYQGRAYANRKCHV